MAIAVHFEFADQSIDKYDDAIAASPDLAHVAERPCHVCYRLGANGFGIFDVWESEESFRHFAAILGPVLDKVGLTFVEPKINAVHNLIVEP